MEQIATWYMGQAGVQRWLDGPANQVNPEFLSHVRKRYESHESAVEQGVGADHQQLSSIDLGRRLASYCARRVVESRASEVFRGCVQAAASRRTPIRTADRVLARDLYELLGAQESTAGLRAAVAPVMPEYRTALAERGRPYPAFINSDGSLLVIAASHLERLCTAFLNQEVDESELRFIATALDLAPDFQFISKEIEECAFFLSTPEANGPPLPEIVSAVLRALRERSA